ncbi:MAG: hypothetical protein FWE98_05770 [Oscillospiraceae bacterium]|nr:hypothetical protein [Oscillospiraceae bacterium]
MKTKKAFALILAALLGLAFVGCQGASNTMVGYSETNTSRSWQGRFKSYQGTQTKALGTPEEGSLLLRYELAAETGELRMALETNGGEVLFEAKAGDAGAFDLALQGSVRYLLRIEGKGAENGSFKLAWEFTQ